MEQFRWDETLWTACLKQRASQSCGSGAGIRLDLTVTLQMCFFACKEERRGSSQPYAAFWLKATFQKKNYRLSHSPLLSGRWRKNRKTLGTQEKKQNIRKCELLSFYFFLLWQCSTGIESCHQQVSDHSWLQLWDTPFQPWGTVWALIYLLIDFICLTDIWQMITDCKLTHSFQSHTHSSAVEIFLTSLLPQSPAYPMRHGSPTAFREAWWWDWLLQCFQLWGVFASAVWMTWASQRWKKSGKLLYKMNSNTYSDSR